MDTETLDRCEHVLHFESLLGARRALSFPCDAGGHVDMDRLGERALCDYLYARAVVGCEFRPPRVRPRARS